MKQPFITQVYESLDGLKLYRRCDGRYYAQNEHEFLSIVGCIMISACDFDKETRKTAKTFLKVLKNAEVFSLTTGKPITVKW